MFTFTQGKVAHRRRRKALKNIDQSRRQKKARNYFRIANREQNRNRNQFQEFAN